MIMTQQIEFPDSYFIHNGFPTREAMIKDLNEKEVFRHECEVKYLLKMPFDDRMKALNSRGDIRGAVALSLLKRSMLDVDPTCMTRPEPEKKKLTVFQKLLAEQSHYQSPSG